MRVRGGEHKSHKNPGKNRKKKNRKKNRKEEKRRKEGSAKHAPLDRQMATPEDALRKLAKLPQNIRCANCEKEDKVFGFKNICMPFRTFVCSMCKAAHQSFSHRVKVREVFWPSKITPALLISSYLFFYSVSSRSRKKTKKKRNAAGVESEQLFYC